MEKYKKLKKELNKKYLQQEYEKDKDDRTIVKMKIENDDDFLSSLSQTKQPVISDNVASFIENEVQNIPLSHSLTLSISGKCIDEKEKEVYPKAIKEYYSEKYISNKTELRNNHIIVFILALLGMAVLGLAILLELKFESFIWAETIDLVRV